MSIFGIMVSETFRGVDTEGFGNFSVFAETDRKKERKNFYRGRNFLFSYFYPISAAIGKRTSDDVRRAAEKPPCREEPRRKATTAEP